MWKGRPLIVGDCDGLRLQVDHGRTGYRVQSVAECADRIVELLYDRRHARRMARAGRERTRERYLLPRLLRDHLRLYTDLLQPEMVATSDAVAAD
jgi:trehalose synthase